MERRRDRALIIALVCLPGLSLGVIQGEELDQADRQLPAEGAVNIRYQNGIIDADITNAPVAEVLRELEAQTGARITPSAPADPGERISATVRTMSLQEGLRIILRGYSFAMYADAGADAPVVILLSKPTSVAVPAAAPAARPGAVPRPGSPGDVNADEPVPGAIPVQPGTSPSPGAPVPAEELSDLAEEEVQNEGDEADEMPLPAR